MLNLNGVISKREIFVLIDPEQPISATYAVDPDEKEAEAARSSWKERWKAFRPRTRHWLVNILIGVIIEFSLHLAGHTFHWETLVNAQNWALDRMMRVNAVIDPTPPEISRPPPKQTFVNIDDALWRSKDWGGGEPYRAPRDRLLKLVENSFALGAQQVILDVIVEGNSTRHADNNDDKLFADGLKRLLNNQKIFGPDKQLVLVRSLRDPLLSQHVEPDKSAKRAKLDFPTGHLSEMRESPYVDHWVAESDGRIVIAAPYFRISADRILRDWQLFQVVCDRSDNNPSGRIQVLPSVQIAVLQKHFGLAVPHVSNHASEVCTPFSQQNDAPDLLPLAEAERLSATLKAKVDIVVGQYWSDLNQTLATSVRPEIRQLKIGTNPPGQDQLGNRVVFRSGGVPRAADPYFNVVMAQSLLDPSLRKDIEPLFVGRVVTIGQTYAEAGDRHHTPLGEMSGSMVLLNAIDSMARYQIIRAPSPWITMPIALLLIVIVGYVFARWDSMLGTVISTAILVATLAAGSFYVFRHGIWLDFALPLVGIQIHRIFASFEERIRMKELARLHGNHH